MAGSSVTTPVIRYLDPSSGNDLQAIPENIRQHVVKDYQREQVAFLVSDMSGFTKLTRKHGVVHFASIIARFRQLTLPILRHYGALVITAEGDSFNVVFPTARGAVIAACEMQTVVKRSNDALPAERAHFRITLDGIGVDFGKGPILDKAGKVHGSVFHNAHLLGEELCSNGKVAISQNVYDQVKDAFASASFHLMTLGDSEHAKKALAEMGSVYEIDLSPTDIAPLQGVDDSEFLQPGLLQLAKRHRPLLSNTDLEQLDTEIKSLYLQRKVALMFDFCFENAETPEIQLSLKYECLSMLRSVFRCYNIEAVEDVLYFLDDPVEAVLVAVASAKLMAKRNQRRCDPGLPKLEISGFGIHIGEVLFVPDSDIHWGDPVNTASKLGQDIAQDGEIYISQQAYVLCEGDARLQGISFRQKEFNLSGVQLKPYLVDGMNVIGSIERLHLDKHVIASFILYDFDTSQGVVSKDEFVTVLKRLQPSFSDVDIANLLKLSGCDDSAKGFDLAKLFQSVLENHRDQCKI